MVSVILVTYNSISVLPNCVESLRHSSSAGELEIVIADNGSKDGTVEWLNEYRQQDLPFVRVVTLLLPDNLGYAYANNRAIERARGDVLLLLNPDTTVDSEVIKTCKEILIADRRLGAVGCRLVLPNGKLDRACKRSFPTLWNSFARFSGLSLIFPRSKLFADYNLSYLSELESYKVDSICGAFMMVPLSTYQVVGGLDEDYFLYGEDIDWCYRIKQSGYEIWYEGSAAALHLKGGNGGKKSAASLQHFYGTMLLYYQKHNASRYPRIIGLLVKLALHLMYYVHTQINFIRRIFG